MNPFFNVAGGLTETRRASRLHKKEKELIGIQAKSFMENLEILESSAAARIKKRQFKNFGYELLPRCAQMSFNAIIKRQLCSE